MKRRSNSVALRAERSAVTVHVAAGAQDIQWFDAQLAETTATLMDLTPGADVL